jgi:muconolactone delta-isomerase
MSEPQFAERLTALEKAVEELRARLVQNTGRQRRWWVETAGRFANDPVFDEIVELGRRYRESLRPKTKRARRDRS